jgi:hypothetical protein
MPRPRWLGRGLTVVAALAAALMVMAAVSLDLVYVLFSAYPQAGRPDTGLSNFLVPMAFGAIPFLIATAFIAWTLLGARTATRAGEPGQPSVDRLILISGVALPCIVVIGFWMGLAASAEELPAGSPAEAALTIYQFTWLSAVLADAATLVVALVGRRTR